MREQDIQSSIIKYIHGLGGYTVKVIKASKSGVPDLICCVGGRFVAFEVKTPRGHVSPLQEYNIEKIREAGGLAFVVRSVDQVENALQDAGLA